jgi:16S rRNA (cytosine967-C5)-methyltransferase
MQVSTSVPANSRSVAADALTELETDSEFADEVIHRHLAESGLKGSDRALAADLFWGTIRWRGRLDAVIGPVFHGDYGRSHPLIRVLLRMGGYQLFCQERIPDHAAVSQTVEIAVNRLGKSAAGLVNAILRRLARERERWDLLPEGADEIGSLAFLHSHPRWNVWEMVSRFGADEAGRALQVNNSKAPLTVMVNPMRWSEDELVNMLQTRGIQHEQSSLIPGYYRLMTASIHQLQPFLDRGQITVQDESAGLVVELMAPERGERILDLCAAPGGKLIAAYTHMGGEGEFVAVEVSEERAERLRQNIERIGATNIEVVVRDAREFTSEPFDRVLVDAPCSAMGLLRKRPDVRWRRKSHHLAAQHKMQSEILNHAAELTKEGGVLVYATCSILPSENIDIANGFLRTHPEYHKEDARGFLAEAVVGAHGDLEVFTHIHDTDGAFASRLRRTAAA